MNKYINLKEIEIERILYFFIFSVLFFYIVKKIIKFIDYIFFTRIANLIIDYIFEEESEKIDKISNTKPTNETLDQKKDKNKESEIENLEQLEILNINNEKNLNRVVGFSIKNKIIGKYTKMYFEKMMQKWKNVNIERVKERLSKIDPAKIKDSDLLRILNSEALIAEVKNKQRNNVNF